MACGNGKSGSAGGPSAPGSPGGPGSPTNPGSPGNAALTLQSIAVSPGAASIGKGAGMNFTAVGTYSDGSTATLPFVTWTSSNEVIATMDSGIGLAQGVAEGGPVTITATESASGLSGTAQLTVTAPVLQSVSISPSVASVFQGYDRQFTLVGRLSDGSSSALTTGVTWSSSAPSFATVNGTGLAHGAAVGSATITASSGAFSTTASLAVTAVVPSVDVSPAHQGAVGAAGVSRYRVTGLQAETEYLVSISTAEPLGYPLVLEVHRDAGFAGLVCSSWAGVPPASTPDLYVKVGPPCRAGVADPQGHLFVQVAGPQDATFTLQASPLPQLHVGGLTDVPPVGARVDTETYYKIDGLTPGSLFEASVSGLVTDDVALAVYDGPGGPFGPGTNLLCSSDYGGAHRERCIGTVPASGAVYATIEGWKSPFKPAPSSFTLDVRPAVPLPIHDALVFPTGFFLAGSVDTSSVQYKISGLAIGTSYTVSLSSLTAPGSSQGNPDADLELYADDAFGTRLCGSYGLGGTNEVCQIVATAPDLYVMVDGAWSSAGASYNLWVSSP